MENKKNNFLKTLSKWYVIWLGMLLGIWSALAITSLSTESTWTESSFENGASITQNMLLASRMWFTCYDSTCSQKIYWKKVSSWQSRIFDAQTQCKNQWMRLPTSADHEWLNNWNFNWLDYDWVVRWFRSQNHNSSRHWFDDMWRSAPNFYQGQPRRWYTNPSYWRSNRTWTWYSWQSYFYCVY